MPVSTIAEAEASDGILGQAEIPFIPTDQRQPRLAPVSDDTIVVVGQARQKKRKRIKTTVLGKPPTGDQDDTGEDEAFDYATVPNLLDDLPPAPEELDTRKKKKQKAKGTWPVVFSISFVAIIRYPIISLHLHVALSSIPFVLRPKCCMRTLT
ncbi:hypothetical protein BDR03DRAFT_599374 [Suillus americanus]|nr:hypothetical protein BDR03DRAFT_599374 [Suillus americanus]